MNNFVKAFKMGLYNYIFHNFYQSYPTIDLITLTAGGSAAPQPPTEYISGNVRAAFASL